MAESTEKTVKTKEARLLVDWTNDEGDLLKAGGLVTAPAEKISELVSAGIADDDAGAVDYAKSQQ